GGVGRPVRCAWMSGNAARPTGGPSERRGGVRLPNGFLRWALVVCGVFSARTAAAQTEEPRVLPPVTPYVDRGWLYGPWQGGIFWNVTARSAPIGGSVAETSLGVGLGLTDRLSVDASLGTIAVAPAVRYSGP